MARSMQVQSYQHQAWEDWSNVVLGILIILAPLVVMKSTTTPALYTGIIAGIVILAMTLLEAFNRLRIEEVVQFLAGAWLLISAFVIDYGGMPQLRAINFVLGGLVALLAIYEFWQDSGTESVT